MIRLREKSSRREIPFELSKFPDGTSQVWKVEAEEGAEVEVLWLFENEAELAHVLQLGRLLRAVFRSVAHLEVPYLPYARQDKQVTNETTWALHWFAALLGDFGTVTCFDQHSKSHFTSRSAEAFHRAVFAHDLVCFPDKGARERYPHLHSAPYVYFDKKRDQLSGRIEGLTLNPNGQAVSGRTVLIVDDLCDAGGTFVEAARQLLGAGAARVDLCVSHGLFSKGREPLHAAGISKIFTTNSLLRNPEGFRVWE